MPKRSAGILVYRFNKEALEVFLVHPGGPYWAGKDNGAWSIPKGMIAPGEEPLEAAKRELSEETGLSPEGEFRPLTPLKQPSGKIIDAWAVEGDADPLAVRSNTFSMEWPPKSGKMEEYPEVDRAGWFELKYAKEKIIGGQIGFLEELGRLLVAART
jgi:predicted NUDIX family NTP pyrophosphohydrolase